VIGKSWAVPSGRWSIPPAEDAAIRAGMVADPVAKQHLFSRTEAQRLGGSQP